MPAGHPCRICSAPAETLKRVNEMIAAGAAELAIAKAHGFSRSSVHRHRHNHVLAVARRSPRPPPRVLGWGTTRAGYTGGRDRRARPCQLARPGGVVGDLREVHDRLQRSAEAAEANEQLLAVGALGAQQLGRSDPRPARPGRQAAENHRAASGPHSRLISTSPAAARERIETDGRRVAGADHDGHAGDKHAGGQHGARFDLPVDLGPRAAPAAPRTSTISMRHGGTRPGAGADPAG